MQLFRQRSGQLGVHESRAANDGNAKAVRRLEQGNTVGSYFRRRSPHSPPSSRG